MRLIPLIHFQTFPGLELCATLLYDASRLMQAYHQTINLSALQLYHAIPALMPDCALFQQVALKSYPKILHPLRSSHWSALVQELSAHWSGANPLQFYRMGSTS